MWWFKRKDNDIWEAILKITDLIEKTVQGPITDNAKIIVKLNSATQKSFNEHSAEINQLKSAVAELQIIVQNAIHVEEK